MALDRQNERETKFLCIEAIELLQPGELFRHARCQPSSLLLPSGLRGETAPYSGAACKFRMCANQCKLVFDVGIIDGSTHCCVERQSRLEWTGLCNALGNPGGALEYAHERCNELGRW